MGAWGMGVFQDDTACEIMEHLIQNRISLEELINKAVASSLTEYVEYEVCHEIIVAGALANALLNGVVYQGINGLAAWLENQDKEAAVAHKADLIMALNKVIGENSELNELWSKNADDYPVWRENIESIINELKG